MSGSPSSQEHQHSKVAYRTQVSTRVSVLLRRIASLRVTLGLWLLLLLLVVYLLIDREASGTLLVLPLGLLALNLVAAILTHATIRSQLALLTFHLALLVFLLLVAVGRLTHFSGKVEVTTGESFDAALVVSHGGPWHNNRLEQIRFELKSFTIAYSPNQGMAQRDETRALVRWRDHRGDVHEGVVGDHRPLLLSGYRFYTTHNKGFSPVFVWTPKGGMPQQGSIHLPSWPAHEFKQAMEWSIPGTRYALWTQLQFEELILDTQRPSQFHPPRQHHLVVRFGEARYTLAPGESIEFPDGRLTYRELRTWMGFLVFHDWTLPWLFAAGITMVLSLAWHYWRKYAIKPWLSIDAENATDRESS